MSTESSASETTPLRRPDSRISEDEVTLPVEKYLPLPKNQKSLDLEKNRVRISNSHRNSHQITNPTQVNLSFSGTIPNNNNNKNHNSDTIKMDTNKRILFRVGIDVFVLLCVGFPILIFFLVGKPYERGFFCDDESLKHPFHESTVRNWMLYIIGLVLPIGVMLAVEIIKSNAHAKRSNGNNTSRQYVFMDYEIPDWMVECYKKIGIFGFGAAACQLTTDIAKYSIGRLRPHFFAVCQPQMLDGSTCSDPINVGKYIVDFKCLGIGSSERMIKEVRLSFPSGHSSFTFFTMVYLALYLQSRMTWRGSKLLRHTLQFCFIMIAWYTALSRVSDYKHHWSDVLSGSLIGALVAVVVARYLSDLFVDKYEKPYVLPRTSHDLTQQTVASNGH